MKKKNASKTASAKSGAEKKASKAVKKTKAKTQKAVKVGSSAKADAKNVTEAKKSEKAVSITKKEQETINKKPEEKKLGKLEQEKIAPEKVEPEKIEQKTQEKPKEPDVIENIEVKEVREEKETAEIKEPTEPQFKKTEEKEPEIKLQEKKKAEVKKAFYNKIPNKYALIGIVASIALIFFMLIFASISNTNNYYIKRSDLGATEIWKGRFAPLGMEKMLVLDGLKSPDILKDKYSKEEIFPTIFNYYIKKADELIDIPGVPDFEKTRENLTSALNYSLSDEHKNAAYARLNIIDLMLLMYRADIAEKRGTLRDLEDALYYLEEATLLDVDESQADVIERKIASLKESIKNSEDKSSTRTAE